MNAWKVILAALVIYVAGIVTGNFAAGLTSKNDSKRGQQSIGGPRPPMMRDLVRRMESRLNLSAEQREQVREIVEASQERMRGLMDDMRPKFENESQSMRMEIESVLTEEQLAMFDRVFEHRGKRGPGGRGPGGRGSGGRGPGGRGEGRFDRGPHGPGGPNSSNQPRRVRPRRPEMEEPVPTQAPAANTAALPAQDPTPEAEQ